MKNRSAYRRLMDAVVVTPELEERVLEAVARRAERRPVIPAARRRILTACAAAACCVVLVVARPFYGGPAVTATPPAVVQGGYGSVEYDSPQALAEALSWPLAIPTALPEGYSLLLAQSLPGELAELRWSDGTDTLCYRMGPRLGGHQRGLHPVRGDIHPCRGNPVGAVPGGGRHDLHRRVDGGRIQLLPLRQRRPLPSGAGGHPVQHTVHRKREVRRLSHFPLWLPA